MRDIVGHCITTNTQQFRTENPRIPCGFFSRRPHCTQCVGAGKYAASITTLGVSVSVDKTKKCVLYLERLWTEQSVQSDMEITRDREKGEVVSPRTMLTKITNSKVYGKGLSQ